MTHACTACLRRTWLLGALADHITRAHERFGAPDSLLALDDAELLAAIGGRRAAALRGRLTAFQANAMLRRAAAAGAAVVCRHDDSYPQPLRDLPDPPAALHVLGRGQALSEATVAVVGARRATGYGLEVAQTLGRGLAAAGVSVVSGMALGVDSAVHEGALQAGPVAPATIAVLGSGADRAYPRTKRALHARLVEAGCVVSELGLGVAPRRWCFPARNRIIAALACATVVVEAAERSGSLITARVARDLGREVGAVPGPVTSSRSRGCNDLIFDGAMPIRDVTDVLDAAFGVGARPAAVQPRDTLEPPLRRLLDEIAGGRDSAQALATTPAQLAETAHALARLELAGHVRRVGAGRYRVVAPAAIASGPVPATASSASCW